MLVLPLLAPAWCSGVRFEAITIGWTTTHSSSLYIYTLIDSLPSLTRELVGLATESNYQHTTCIGIGFTIYTLMHMDAYDSLGLVSIADPAPVAESVGVSPCGEALASRYL